MIQSMQLKYFDLCKSNFLCEILKIFVNDGLIAHRVSSVLWSPYSISFNRVQYHDTVYNSWCVLQRICFWCWVLVVDPSLARNLEFLRSSPSLCWIHVPTWWLECISSSRSSILPVSCNREHMLFGVCFGCDCFLILVSGRTSMP